MICDHLKNKRYLLILLVLPHQNWENRAPTAVLATVGTKGVQREQEYIEKKENISFAEIEKYDCDKMENDEKTEI